MLSKFAPLAMSINGVVMDVIDSWGDDLLPVGGGNLQDLDGGVRAIVVVSYGKDDGHHQYGLYENGVIHRVTSETHEDGHTWNGDDEYFKAYKTTYSIHEKIDQIQIQDLDYDLEENVENVVCQMIESLREHGL